MFTQIDFFIDASAIVNLLQNILPQDIVQRYIHTSRLAKGNVQKELPVGRIWAQEKRCNNIQIVQGRGSPN